MHPKEFSSGPRRLNSTLLRPVSILTKDIRTRLTAEALLCLIQTALSMAHSEIATRILPRKRLTTNRVHIIPLRGLLRWHHLQRSSRRGSYGKLKCCNLRFHRPAPAVDLYLVSIEMRVLDNLISSTHHTHDYVGRGKTFDTLHWCVYVSEGT